jgi:hypothetical protein
VAGGRRRGVEQWNFHPKVVYKRKKSGRTSECSASGSEASEWSSSSDEDSEALYHKRYVFTKKMAKSIIYVHRTLCIPYIKCIYTLYMCQLCSTCAVLSQRHLI